MPLVTIVLVVLILVASAVGIALKDVRLHGVSLACALIWLVATIVHAH